MSTKTAVVVFSDPATGSEEALGRVFNALATVWEYAQTGEAMLVFQGTGTRWPEHLDQGDHPAHALWQAVRESVAQVVASGGCAVVFGADSAVADAGLETVSGNQAPGTPGVASFRSLTEQGYQILTF